MRLIKPLWARLQASPYGILGNGNTLFHRTAAGQAITQDLFGLDGAEQLAGRLDTAVLQASLQTVESGSRTLLYTPTGVNAITEGLVGVVVANLLTRRGRRGLVTTLVNQTRVEDLSGDVAALILGTSSIHALDERRLGKPVADLLARRLGGLMPAHLYEAGVKKFSRKIAARLFSSTLVHARPERVFRVAVAHVLTRRLGRVHPTVVDQTIMEDLLRLLGAILRITALLDATLEHVPRLVMTAELARRLGRAHAALRLHALPQNFEPERLAILQLSAAVDALLESNIGLLFAKLPTAGLWIARFEAFVPKDLALLEANLEHAPAGQTLFYKLFGLEEASVPARIRRLVRLDIHGPAGQIRRDNSLASWSPGYLALGRIALSQDGNGHPHAHQRYQHPRFSHRDTPQTLTIPACPGKAPGQDAHKVRRPHGHPQQWKDGTTETLTAAGRLFSEGPVI